jgi:hypothetical protein
MRPLVGLGLALLLLVLPDTARADEHCNDSYPHFTRFLVEDGPTAPFCSEFLRLGGERVFGLPISRPFQIGPELYQAFEYGVLWWRADLGQADLVDTLDLLHAVGRDPFLERLGVPPAQAPSLDWLTDAALTASRGNDPRGVFGLPTSPPTPAGPYVVQRFQRAVARRWVEPVPYDIGGSVSRAPDGSRIERVMAGDLLRAAGLIPPAALVVDPGLDVPAAPPSLWQDPPRAVGGWQALDHRVGAFNVGSLDEVSRATDLGLMLGVNAYVGRDSPAVKAGLDRNFLLVDTYPWDRIAALCGGAAQTRRCQLDADQLASLEEQIRHHLLLTRLDDSVVAYWVLDDDPGEVRPALERIHHLVQAENLLDRQPRPTICGFGGDLDSSAAFDRAVGNFTPTGCDAVALYPYRRGSAGDFSMPDLLPHMLQRLQALGWDPTTQPLIGVPQTFAFGSDAPPSAAEVIAQTTAYCAAGASSILFYAWNDTDPGPKAQLFNTPTLRAAAASAMAQCQDIWGTA